MVYALRGAKVLAVEHLVYALLLDPEDVPIVLFGLLPLAILQCGVDAVAEVSAELDVGAA